MDGETRGLKHKVASTMWARVRETTVGADACRSKTK